ncbi:MAG: hypothetical protein WKF63_09635 [Thermomicrobiales bacterium]
MTYLITTNGTRRQLPRPQLSDASDDLAIVHRPRTDFDDGCLEAVSVVQRAGQPIYRVTGLRARVWCPESLTARVAAHRQPWQPMIVPDHLDTHDEVVAWLVAEIAGDGETALDKVA